MEIKSFSHRKGLKKSRLWTSKPYFIADYCEIEFNISADQDFEAIFIWSLDGKNCPEYSKMQCPKSARIHQEFIRVNNPYVALQLRNLGHPATNNSLYVRAVGIKPDTRFLESPVRKPQATSPDLSPRDRKSVTFGASDPLNQTKSEPLISPSPRPVSEGQTKKPEPLAPNSPRERPDNIAVVGLVPKQPSAPSPSPVLPVPILKSPAPPDLSIPPPSCVDQDSVPLSEDLSQEKNLRDRGTGPLTSYADLSETDDLSDLSNVEKSIDDDLGERAKKSASSSRKKKGVSRFSSPFHSRPKVPGLRGAQDPKREKPPKIKDPKHIRQPADTIPGFVPKEALLVGGDSNSIRTLSKGADGDVLSVREGSLTWSETDPRIPSDGKIGDILFMAADGMRWMAFREAVTSHVRLAVAKELDERGYVK